MLDTHALIWFLDGSSQLSSVARSLIEDENNDILVSVGSLWEMAIKVSLGKLHLGLPFDYFIRTEFAVNGLSLLGITAAHAAAVASLPFYHRDPFDRLLIAQAQVEGTPIISADAAFDAYPITRLW
jgi:PIN domain nuclease of toxin-antitoxin system